MYSIKAVSQATGLSIETLRAWERRYGTVAPQRDANGRRSYSADQVARLRRLREATDRGYSIGKIASLPIEEVNRLLAQPGQSAPRRAPGQNFAADVLRAAADYQPEVCDQSLAMAFALMPLPQVVEEVLAPALREVGERWHRGEFSIAQERLVSSAVRRQLANVIETFNRVNAGTSMVLATLSGERHELGILMCALLAASHGVRCHYLGADLPAREISTYAAHVAADIVALSFVTTEDSELALHELSVLMQQLPATTQVWIGGRGVEQLDAARLPPRVVRHHELEGFLAELALYRGRANH